MLEKSVYRKIFAIEFIQDQSQVCTGLLSEFFNNIGPQLY